MPVTTHMVMTLPTEDGSSGTWDSVLNAALQLVDAHDHSTGKGVTVKSAGISINADLPFGGYAATGMKAVDFAAIAAATMSGHAHALFASSADNELYWRTSAGVNVKLTSGTSLNSALLGGFTGDYGAGAEEARFTSGTSIYDFKVAATTRGYIDCSDLRLFEATAGVTNAVKLKSPASLAASYTLTMPDANPSGASKLLKASTSGVLAYTGAATHDGNLTQTGTMSVSGLLTASAGLAVTGAATISTTLGVTGLITATAGVTCAANQHVTVSGTGEYKHGNRKQTFSPALCLSTTPGSWTGSISIVASGGSSTGYLTLPGFIVGDRLKSIKLRVLGDGAADLTWSLSIIDESGTATTIGSNVVVTNPPASWADSNNDFADHTLVEGESVHIVLTPSASGLQVINLTVTYDHP